MKGSVRKQKDGRWLLRVDAGFHDDGRRRQISRRYRTKALAEAALKDLLPQAYDGVAPVKAITVEEWTAEWLRSVEGRITPRSYSTYQTQIRSHVLPHLGNLRLSAVTERVISRWLTDLRGDRRDGEDKPLSERSVHCAFSVLSTCLRAAVRRRLISRNPCDTEDRPSHPKSEARWVSIDQVPGLLRELEGDWLYPAVLAAVGAGLRRGEAAALRWSDVDLAEGVLRVSRSVSYAPGHGVFLKGPKSKGGTIPLPPVVVEGLRRVRAQSQGQYVVGDTDSPVHPERLGARWRRWARQHGYNVSFHGLRHTYGALMVEAKVHPAVSRDLFRHSSLKMSALYSHASNPQHVAAAAGVGGLLTARDQPVIGPCSVQRPGEHNAS